MVARAGWMAAIAAASVMAGSASAGAQASAKHPASAGHDPARHDTSAKPPPTGASAGPAPSKPTKPMTRRQEIEHAIDVRAVPERYRSSVPKEYQKYIPFEKAR